MTWDDFSVLLVHTTFEHKPIETDFKVMWSTETTLYLKNKDICSTQHLAINFSKLTERIKIEMVEAGTEDK